MHHGTKVEAFDQVSVDRGSDRRQVGYRVYTYASIVRATMCTLCPVFCVEFALDFLGVRI
jgi:hypothetical protein